MLRKREGGQWDPIVIVKCLGKEMYARRIIHHRDAQGMTLYQKDFLGNFNETSLHYRSSLKRYLGIQRVRILVGMRTQIVNLWMVSVRTVKSPSSRRLPFHPTNGSRPVSVARFERAPVFSVSTGLRCRERSDTSECFDLPNVTFISFRLR